VFEELLDDASFIAVFAMSHRKIKELFTELKEPHRTGLRAYPETLFAYAAIMPLSHRRDRLPYTSLWHRIWVWDTGIHEK
jgi:hypothetical protein